MQDVRFLIWSSWGQDLVASARRRTPARQGMAHVLLEAGAAHANTIQQYQHYKHVMAEPSVLPLRSDMEFAAGRREAILGVLGARHSRQKVNIKYRAEVPPSAARVATSRSPSSPAKSFAAKM